MSEPRSATKPSRPSLLDAQQLVERVSARRRSRGLSQRQAAAAIGISPSTLSRIEQGGHLPHREPLLRIARWLDVPVEFSAEEKPGGRDGGHPPDLSTLEAVELHVRADQDLSSADADALIESFRVLYEHLRGRRDSVADRVGNHASDGAHSTGRISTADRR